MKNTVILIGRITKDIELRNTKNGTEAVKFTIAIPRDYKNANGDYESDFVSITAYKQSARYLNEYAKKGDLVGVKGRIMTGTYEKEGEKKYKQDIIADSLSLLSSSTKKEEKQEEHKEIKRDIVSEQFEEFAQEIELDDDSLPF